MAEIEPEIPEGADASQDPELEASEAEAEEVESKGSESEAESPTAEDDNLEEKTNPLQERIDKLTKRFYDADRKAQEKDREIAELREQLSKPKEDAKTLEDFDYDQNKYISYLEERIEKRATEAAERVAKQFQTRTEAERTYNQFLERAAKFEEEAKDYQDVISPDGNPSLVITPTMAREIHASELGPQLAYYLGKNTDIALELSRLPERDMVRRMTLLEVELKTSKKAAIPKKVSKAPPPPAKIKGSDAGLRVSPTDPASDKLSDEEWFKAEEKRKAKLRG